MSTPKTTFYSTAPEERILSIDVLRGFAVLGILIMNIQSFSMISAAYLNPTAYGDLSGINKWVWILSQLFAANKFMTIFSMLFGAGILLFTDRALSKGKKAGQLHYRRNFWLLVFGMAHGYLIWQGDILVAYSLCAFLAYLFRKLKPKTLLIIGGLFFIVPILLYLFFGMSIQYWPEESYKANMDSWLPGIEKVQFETDSLQGGWLTQMKFRVPATIFMQTFLFFIQVFWRVIALMLFGMAFYKWGILSANKSKLYYKRMVAIGLGIGLIIVGFGIYQNFKASWLMDYSMFIGSQFNYIGSVAVSIGYIGLINLLIKSDQYLKFKKILSAVGKMAFTNYIFMSLICTFIFYGHGFGYFGQVERWGQILIVFAIWLMILVMSPWWLKHYQYGPLEWLWRLLTYWKKPEFLKKK